jgi:hypothetical protein
LIKQVFLIHLTDFVKHQFFASLASFILESCCTAFTNGTTKSL